MLFNLARTRGEHPVVLSFISSRRSVVGLLNGEWYSRISRTHLRALSIGRPHSNGLCMGLEALSFRQRDDRGRDAVQPVAGEMLNGNGLHEVLYAESCTKARHS